MGIRGPRWHDDTALAGDGITPENANYGESGIGKTTEVGTYPENPFKLHDILGNVYEWGDDYYENSYSNTLGDGSARQTSDKNSARVLRGGSWGNGPRNVRAANRVRNAAIDRSINVGFRVARAL